jgi:UDP-3-O-[3-hydroxymyristoyl] glucosamine N-acyltransferase
VGDGAYVGDGSIVGSASVLREHAVIGSSAHLNSGVIVGDFAIVGDAVRVGTGSSLGSRSRVAAGSILGDHVSVGEYAELLVACSLGHRVRVHSHTRWRLAPPQIGLRDFVVYIPAPGCVRFGLTDLSFAECTEEKLQQMCWNFHYPPAVAVEYVRAALWLVEGCQSGALYQGEVASTAPPSSPTSLDLQ